MEMQPIALVLFVWTGLGMILAHFLGVKRIFKEQENSVLAGVKFGLLGPLFWFLFTMSCITALKRSHRK